MIKQDIELERIGWHVSVYYAVDQYYADEIIDVLIRTGCRGKQLTAAKRNLWSGKLDGGLTFANADIKEAVMVIGLTSSASQHANSTFHEQMHLMAYIADSLGLDPYGEEICYIGGELAQKMHSITRLFECDCCRKKVLGR